MENNSESSIPSELANLYGMVDKQNIYGLNLSVPETAKDIIKPWDQRDSTTTYAESNVDDQLILHIPFHESVRIKSIFIKVGRGETAPRHLNVYVNNPTIVDFDDAESMKPQLELALRPDEGGVVEYPIRVATLGNVTALSLFFKDSEVGDTSRIYYLGFKGDLRTLRTPGTSALEVPAAGSAEAKLIDRVKNKLGAQQTMTR